MKWFTVSDLEWVFMAVFALEFLFIAIKGFQTILNLVWMDREVRHRYEERANFIMNFYKLYLNQKSKVEEEERLAEEARAARVAALAAEHGL